MNAPAAAGMIGAYLDEVGRRLPGGRADRQDVLDELYDHLVTATAAGVRAGMDAEAAASVALRESGPPELVARSWTAELLAAQVRRGAWRVVLLLLAGGLAWQACRTLLPAELNAAVPAAGWQRTVFLAGVDTVRTLPSVIQVGALALLAVVRMLSRRGAGWRLVGWLGGVVSVTMAAMLVSCAAVAVSADGHPATVWLVFGAPTSLVMVWALAESVRAARSSRALSAAAAPPRPR